MYIFKYLLFGFIYYFKYCCFQILHKCLYFIMGFFLTSFNQHIHQHCNTSTISYCAASVFPALFPPMDVCLEVLTVWWLSLFTDKELESKCGSQFRLRGFESVTLCSSSLSSGVEARRLCVGGGILEGLMDGYGEVWKVPFGQRALYLLWVRTPDGPLTRIPPPSCFISIFNWSLDTTATFSRRFQPPPPPGVDDSSPRSVSITNSLNLSSCQRASVPEAVALTKGFPCELVGDASGSEIFPLVLI